MSIIALGARIGEKRDGKVIASNSAKLPINFERQLSLRSYFQSVSVVAVH